MPGRAALPDMQRIFLRRRLPPLDKGGRRGYLRHIAAQLDGRRWLPHETTQLGRGALAPATQPSGATQIGELPAPPRGASAVTRCMSLADVDVGQAVSWGFLFSVGEAARCAATRRVDRHRFARREPARVPRSR
jgi:hypothetical protein